ncbi:MAG: arylesterase [Vicinamibacterales bacterium]
MRTPLLLWCLALGCALGWACSAPGSSSVPPESQVAAPPEPASATTLSERRPEIVILGDSLTAGLGLDSTQSFPALIQQRLDERGLRFQVVNAGVSGDTSAGGLRRLEWALEGNPRVLIVALGGNDALRGLPIEDLERNLTAIIERGKREGLVVILAGMEAPPNNGPEYTARFRRVYRDLASAHDVVLIPFLLEGVAGEAAFNQADGIHPNEEGARLVADTVWRALEPVLKAAAGTR